VQKLIEKISPHDLIAIAIIGGGFWLKFSGADGVVGTLLASVCFYYFGKRVRNDNQ